MAHILDLPKEIVMIIFNYILLTENQRYFLSSISKVCKTWESICQDSKFWHKIDGSLQIEDLCRMKKSKSLLKTKELIFCPTYNLKLTKKLANLLAKMPNLKLVNISKCLKYDIDVLFCLNHTCNVPAAIVYPDRNRSLPILLKEILEYHGQNLIVLDLSREKFDLKTYLIEVSKICLHLEEILVEHVKSSEEFPLKEIQEGCTKVRVLKSGCPVKFSKHSSKENLGFPLLEVFTYDNIVYEVVEWDVIDNSTLSDKDLKNILSKSPLLKQLDLVSCQHISIDVVLSLPATHLESLSLSRSKLCSTKRLGDILVKWIRSLRILDISNMSPIWINEILSEVTKRKRMTKLEKLDLSDTKINPETIIKVIDNCANLKSINLSSCRLVGRGCRHKFKNRAALLQLHELFLSRQKD